MSDYPLILNGKKVSYASEIPENYDIIMLRGYLTANLLGRWLFRRGGRHYAQKLEQYDLNRLDLGDVLNAVFKGIEIPDSIDSGRREREQKNTAYIPYSVLGKEASALLVNGSFPKIYRRLSGSYSVNQSYSRSYVRSVHSSYSGSFYGSFAFGSCNSVRVIPHCHFRGHTFSVKAAYCEQEDMTYSEFLNRFPLNKRGYGIHLI